MDDGKFGSEWIRAFLQLNAIPGGVIQWPYVVGPGGGGIRIGQYGITSVTDAGAAGVPPLTYDPTNDWNTYGLAGGFFVRLGATYGAGIGYNSAAMTGTLMATTSIYKYISGGLGSQMIATGEIWTGWLLAKGVHLTDEFNYVTWSAAAAALGALWYQRGAAAPTLVTPTSGGIAQISHGAIADSWNESQGAFFYAQDGLRMYARVSLHVETDIMCMTGFSTAWDAGGHKAYSAGAGDQAAVFGADTSIGAFWYCIGVHNGAVTAVSSTVAPAADTAVQIDAQCTTAGVWTWTLDGVARGGLTAAQGPVITTAMLAVWGMCPLAVAAKICYWDTIKAVNNRNPRVTLI